MCPPGSCLHRGTVEVHFFLGRQTNLPKREGVKFGKSKQRRRNRRKEEGIEIADIPFTHCIQNVCLL